MVKHVGYHLLLLALVASIPDGRGQGQDEELTLEKPVHSLELGSDGELVCTSSNMENDTQTQVLWFKGDNSTGLTPYPENDTLRIYANNTEGTLYFKAVMFNDTGFYLCQSQDGATSVVAELHVFIMPDYFQEGMIILGINLGLLVIFAACALNTFIQKYRSDKMKAQKGNVEAANKAQRKRDL